MAAAIRVSSRGPVIYRSVRPGIGGAPFACLKFRTMYRDADQRQADLESLNEATGALFKMRDDPRTTAVGRVLRRFSLDELPQLFNVLMGDMSLVGPRPLPVDPDAFDDVASKRHRVRPGITGPWQVAGGHTVGYEDMIKLDLSYVDTWSIRRDLWLLMMTIPTVLVRRSAY
jgi:lipopolysaccharide/colanic/teichoic acid biosynthesis glycosyltransferase